MIGHACIVGAGIAGLTAALALERAGVQVALYEGQSKLRSTGGTLMLWSNALAALDKLGLAGEVLAAGTQLEHIDFKSWNGRLLWAMPVGSTSRRHGWPCIVVQRQTLLQVLAAHLRTPIYFGARYVAHVERGRDVRVLFQNGLRVESELLIGADGARSRVREQLAPGRSAFPSGQIGWLGHSRSLDVREGASIGTLGRGARFWCVGLHDGEVSWYATVPAKRGIKTRADLARAFADCHSPVPDLIDAAEPDSVGPVEILDQHPLLRWSTGQTTLAGDAAHCVRPEIGQGACQAIVSALALAFELARPHASINSALRRYEARRRSQMAQVQLLARTTALHIDVEHPALCVARDIGVATSFARLALPTLDWLLSGAQTSDQKAWQRP